MFHYPYSSCELASWHLNNVFCLFIQSFESRSHSARSVVAIMNYVALKNPSNREKNKYCFKIIKEIGVKKTNGKEKKSCEIPGGETRKCKKILMQLKQKKVIKEVENNSFLPFVMLYNWRHFRGLLNFNTTSSEKEILFTLLKYVNIPVLFINKKYILHALQHSGMRSGCSSHI